MKIRYLRQKLAKLKPSLRKSKISMMRVGEVGTVVSISGKEDVRRFLNELGFTPGTEVRAVSQAGGNIILEVKDSKIAIDRHMANRILFCPAR